MTNHCPIYDSTFLELNVDFFKNFRIGGRYWWVLDRGAIGKIVNDKSDTKWEEFEEKHADRSYSRWSQWLDKL